MKAVWFLVGATASGKKSVALRLRDRFNGVLLSMDSMKVYRGLDKGTDKPAPGTFGLVDLVEPDATWSVGDYVRVATEAAEQAFREGRQPIFVGGTGLYLRALARGLFDGPVVPDAVRTALRERVRLEGSTSLHVDLARVDPTCAERIHPHDAQRIVRALEVWEHTGRALSDWQKETTRKPWDFDHRIVGLRWDPAALRRRIDQRVDRMFAEGLVDEVRGLLSDGRLGAQAREAIGYREVVDHVEGRLSLEACHRAVQQNTWTFSRRQRNWCGQFAELVWVDAGEVEPTTEAVAAAWRPDGPSRT